MLIKATHRWRYPEMALQTLMQIQQQEILTIQSRLENVNSMKDKYFRCVSLWDTVRRKVLQRDMGRGD